MTDYRAELGIGSEVVVMYAGNVGFSQSLENLVEFARRTPSVAVVINGDGVALQSLRALAWDLANVYFGGYQPEARLAEVLATGDIHVVPLRAGLAAVSVPSKTYSILAAGRPVVAAVDAGTEIDRLLERAGAGLSVAPDDVESLCKALSSLAVDAPRRDQMGANGRNYVERHVTARDVAEAYVRLLPDSLSNS
jgi:colanic acid biosynthesis glycosyl transferase WcaI